MSSCVLRRVPATLPVMGVVAVIVFLMLWLSPGNPAAIIAGDQASSAAIAQIREYLGLDRPLGAQFLRWVGQLVTGDFGNSPYLNRPVLGLIMESAEPTLFLSMSTVAFVILLALPPEAAAGPRRLRARRRLSPANAGELVSCPAP